jgi:general secretion pathway protein D
VKASLSVGQSIPFPTGSLASQAAGAGATLALSTSYSRQDVALRMELTPHLNDSDSIRLEIDGEISDVPEGQTAGSAGPITNKRTLKTAVVVGDGETVVLGGLQKDGETETVEKVPGLGDIPILGKLFQYKKRQRTKQNLLIVLTPHVIRGPDDLRRIFQRKEDERREFVERETAFRTPWSPPVDWARKRGLLEEINVVARRADEEAAAVQAAARALKKPPVEGEVQ